MCAPESRTGLGFCSSHPPGPAPWLSEWMHTCPLGLGAHLAPVVGGHSRCALQWSGTDAPSDLGSLWSSTPDCGLSIPPGGLLRQSIFHLPAGQLAALPPASNPSPTHPPASPSPSPRKTLTFGGSMVACQTPALRVLP